MAPSIQAGTGRLFLALGLVAEHYHQGAVKKQTNQKRFYDANITCACVCAYTLPTMVRHVRVRAMCYVTCVCVLLRACHACVCALLCAPCVRVRHVCVCAMYVHFKDTIFSMPKKSNKKNNNERRRHYHLRLKLHLHHGLLHIKPASENDVSSSLRKLQIKSNSPLCRRQSGTTGFPLLLWHETIAATSGSHVELIVIVR